MGHRFLSALALASLFVFVPMPGAAQSSFAVHPAAHGRVPLFSQLTTGFELALATTPTAQKLTAELAAATTAIQQTAEGGKKGRRAKKRQETRADEKRPTVREQRRELGIDPCRLDEIRGNKWLDRINRGLHRAVCESALWFDDLFGDQLLEEDRGGTWGRLLLGLEYDDRENLEDLSNFRAEFELPQAERRISGFIGRGDRDEIVSDQQPRTGSLPNRAASLPDDDEWLVGLGYSPHRSSRLSSWSGDIGADLEFPLNWYAKVRHKRVFYPSEATMLRLRQTFFWERDKGFGVTSRADFDYLLPKNFLLRWRNIGRLSETDDGLDWYSELTLFQNLGQQRAIAYQLSSSGETGAPVGLEYVLARVIYRQSILREWFFLDIRPGVSYRRDPGQADREWRPVLAVGFEILFGRLTD